MAEIIYADDGPVGILITEEQPGATSEPTLRELSEGLIAVYGTDYGVHSPITRSHASPTRRGKRRHTARGE